MSAGKLAEALTSDERRQLSEFNSCLFGYIKFEESDQCPNRLLIQKGISYYETVIKDKLKAAAAATTANNSNNSNVNATSNATTSTSSTTTASATSSSSTSSSSTTTTTTSTATTSPTSAASENSGNTEAAANGSNTVDGAATATTSSSNGNGISNTVGSANNGGSGNNDSGSGGESGSNVNDQQKVKTDGGPSEAGAGSATTTATAANTKQKKVNVDPNIYCHLGHLHLLLEDFTKALSAYQKFHNVQSDNWKDAAFLYGLGLVYFHFNAYKWATQLFQQLLYAEPGFRRASDVHLRLALMFKVTKQYDNSLKHFKLTLVDSNPCICSKAEVRLHIAHLYEVQGKYKQAKEAYETLVKTETLTPVLKAAGLRQLGWLYYTVGQLADKPTRESLAIQYLKASVDIDSSNGQAWYLLGRCFSGVGRVHDAFDAYRQSIDKSEANADTWCSIGVLYQQQNQPMDALQAYICAVQLDKSHSAAWADLGVLYETCNQPNDALTCYLNATRNTDVNANLAAKIKFLQQNLANMPMQHFQNKSQTLPSIEEAWRLPIPAELTSRQGTTGPVQPSGKPGGQGSLSPFEDDDKKPSDKSRKRPSNEPMEMPPPPPQPSPSPGQQQQQQHQQHQGPPPMSLSPQQYHMMQRLMSNQASLNPQQQHLLQQLQHQHLLSQQFKQRQQNSPLGSQNRMNASGSSPLPSSSLSPLGPGGPSSSSSAFMPGLPPTASSSSSSSSSSAATALVDPTATIIKDEKFPISSQDIAMAEDVLAQFAGDKKFVGSSSSSSLLSSLSSSSSLLLPSSTTLTSSPSSLTAAAADNTSSSSSSSSSLIPPPPALFGSNNGGHGEQQQQLSAISTSSSSSLLSSSPSSSSSENVLLSQGSNSNNNNFNNNNSSSNTSNNSSIITKTPSGSSETPGNNNNNNTNSGSSSSTNDNSQGSNNNGSGGDGGQTTKAAAASTTTGGQNTPSSSSTSLHSSSSSPSSSRKGGDNNDGQQQGNDEDDDNENAGTSSNNNNNNGSGGPTAAKDIFTVSATKELGLVLKRSSADAALMQREVKPAITKLDTGMSATKVMELSKGQGLVHRHLISIQGDNYPPPRPPPPPCPPLPKESLNPPTPSVYLDNKKEAFSSQLQQFCHQQPVVVIRGIAGALKLDLGLFSTKSLVEANPDHPVEMRTQKQQAPDENFDAQGRRLWYCDSCRGLTSVKKYAQYQASSFQESLREEQEKSSKGPSTVKESDSDSNSSLTMKKKRFKTIKFGTNVDLSDETKWRAQLHELSKLPSFCRLVSGSNMLSHIGHTILGMNTVQLYMKVPGSRTPGHQENNNFCSVNINIGPGDCEWFAVPDQYWGVIQDMCERNGVNYLRGSWWPVLEDLYEEDVPVYRFIQKPGDLVWIGPGTVHWVQAIGWCNNIAWNVGPLTYRQYTLGVERYEYNRLESYKSIVPVVSLSWNLAQNMGIAEPKLHNAIKTTLMRSLRQVKMTVDLVEDLKKEIKWHGRTPDEATHYCEDCEIEVFNILFVKEVDGQFLVHCQDCALKASPSLGNFVVLNQYTLEELCSMYDKFKVHTPHQGHHLFGMAAFS